MKTQASYYVGCYQAAYGNWNLFQGGMTQYQAQMENTSVTPYQTGQSGYLFQSSLMTVDLCLTTCYNYGFVYAGLNPK